MTIDGVVERIADGVTLLENLGILEDVNTWQTSQEVFTDWNEGDPVEEVHTANMGVYRLDGGYTVFDLLSKEGNLFVEKRFRADAYQGILYGGFFFPSDQMKEHVMSAINQKKSVTVHYSKLSVKTKNCSSNYCYIEVDGSNTDEDKKLFRAVYGTIPKKGKKVFLLREEVVKDQLIRRKGDLIALPCYLDFSHNLNADEKNVDFYRGAIRGVRSQKVR